MTRSHECVTALARTTGRQQTVVRSLRSSKAFRFALGVPSLCKRKSICVRAPACIATWSTSIGPDLQIARRVPVAYSEPRGETLSTILTIRGIATGCRLTATCPSVVVQRSSSVARHLSAAVGRALARCSTRALTAPALAACGLFTWKRRQTLNTWYVRSLTTSLWMAAIFWKLFRILCKSGLNWTKGTHSLINLQFWQRWRQCRNSVPKCPSPHKSLSCFLKTL